MNNVILFYQRNFSQKTRGKHAKCACGGVMKRIYMKFQYSKRATFKAVGWVCLECYNVVLD